MPTAQSQPRDGRTRRSGGRRPRASRGARRNRVVESAGRSACAHAGGSDAGFARGPCSRCSAPSRYFSAGSPAGDSLFRLAEALPRIPDRPSRIAMLADRVPHCALEGGGRPAVRERRNECDRAAIRLRGNRRRCAAARRARRARLGGSALLLRHAGGGARTAADADRNFRRYMDAIRAMERAAGARAGVWRERLEVSVKLSSIHPRYDAASYAQVRAVLLDRLRQISGRAAAAGYRAYDRRRGIGKPVLQLDLFAALASDPALDPWGGLGLRCSVSAAGAADGGGIVGDRGRPPQTRRHADRGAAGEGAYWDAEVKRAQELGLARYPVFTDKRLTDLSYLACARRLSAGLDSVYRSSPRTTR